MKLKSLLTGAALALMTVCGAAAAQAGVVTFDDAEGNALLYSGVSPFSDQGLTFTGSPNMYIWDGSSPNSNGTNANLFGGYTPQDHETITLTGGGRFALISMDLALSWYDPNATDTITINGKPLTISPTLKTYDLDLMNVSSVTISDVASVDGYWLADNIVFGAAVPEPATWAILILGLGMVGLAARRRNPAVALAA